ncbi:MAG: nicotinate phosphoribosyltransferase, partial [Eggerthellaceae bacterium]
DSPWEPCLKVTGQSSKQTVPGVLDVRRYFHSSGKLAGDMVFDTTHGVAQERIIDPADELRQKDLAGKDYVTLLEPLARHGKVVLDAEHRNALVARDYCHDQLELLDESQKRIMNPHSYPVGLEYSLFYRRHELASRLLGLS